jgi:hypothetical protein
MKKIIILAGLFVAGINCFAQDVNANYDNVRRSNQYVATYYSGSLWGVNGFRSVEDENRIMEQNLAELRRQRELEEMTPEEREELRRRRQMKWEIKNEAIQARKEKEEASRAKKLPAAKKDSVAVSKVKKETAAIKKEAPKTAAAKPAAQTVTAKKEDPKKKK